MEGKKENWAKGKKLFSMPVIVNFCTFQVVVFFFPLFSHLLFIMQCFFPSVEGKKSAECNDILGIEFRSADRCFTIFFSLPMFINWATILRLNPTPFNLILSCSTNTAKREKTYMPGATTFLEAECEKSSSCLCLSEMSFTQPFSHLCTRIIIIRDM